MSTEEKMQKVLEGASSVGELTALSKVMLLAITTFERWGRTEYANKLRNMHTELAAMSIRLVDETDALQQEIVGASDEQG